MTTNNNFTELLWNGVEPIYKKITQHPFIQELALGTLKKDIFAYYIVQDKNYLIDLSKALAITSAKTNDNTHMQFFLDLAYSIVHEEKTMHEFYLSFLSAEIDLSDLTQATFSYTHFLLSTASLKSYEEITAAFLPCFWIYKEIAQYLHQRISLKDNLYASWVLTYTSPTYTQCVSALINLVNEIGENATKTTQKAMQNVFNIAAQLEWQFWNDAYHKHTAFEKMPHQKDKSIA